MFGSRFSKMMAKRFSNSKAHGCSVLFISGNRGVGAALLVAVGFALFSLAGARSNSYWSDFFPAGILSALSARLLIEGKDIRKT